MGKFRAIAVCAPQVAYAWLRYRISRAHFRLKGGFSPPPQWKGRRLVEEPKRRDTSKLGFSIRMEREWVELRRKAVEMSLGRLKSEWKGRKPLEEHKAL